VSSLWTPGGERPVPPPTSGGGRQPPPKQPGGPAPDQAAEEPEEDQEEELSAEEMQKRLSELRADIAEAPASAVVANHCFGLFELAALHLSLKPPKLADARLAIDALGALVEGLRGRLGDEERPLRDGLAQLRLAYVEIDAAMGPPAQPPEGDGDQAATGATD